MHYPRSYFNSMIVFSTMSERAKSREQVAGFLKKVDRKELTERRAAMREQRDKFHVQFNSLVDLIHRDNYGPTVD